MHIFIGTIMKICAVSVDSSGRLLQWLPNLMVQLTTSLKTIEKSNPKYFLIKILHYVVW